MSRILMGGCKFRFVSNSKDWKLEVVESSRLHFCLLIGGLNFQKKAFR